VIGLWICDRPSCLKYCWSLDAESSELEAGAVGVAVAATYVLPGATNFDACTVLRPVGIWEPGCSCVHCCPLLRNYIFCSCWDVECRFASFVFLRVILVTMAIPKPEIHVFWGLLTVGPYVAETLAEVTLRQTCFYCIYYNVRTTSLVVPDADTGRN
jgi:hypothetical protein